jgi:hypothetical protein
MMKSLELLMSSVRKLQQEESNNYTYGYHSRKNQQNTIQNTVNLNQNQRCLMRNQ